MHEARSASSVSRESINRAVSPFKITRFDYSPFFGILNLSGNVSLPPKIFLLASIAARIDPKKLQSSIVDHAINRALAAIILSLSLSLSRAQKGAQKCVL